MRCPFCGHMEDKVVDSRESREGDAIRRRRECLKCARRFTSYERLEEVPILIVKKDGRREPFDRAKLQRGIMAACQKRPVSLSRQEEVVADIQARLVELPDREIPSRTLGELVMDALKLTDSVAYVRFASVYRDFKDLPDFLQALEGLMGGASPHLSGPSRIPAAPVSAAPVQPPAPTPAPPPMPVPAPVPAQAPPPARVPSSPAILLKKAPAPPEPPAQQPLFPGVAPAHMGPPKRRKR